MKTGVKSLCLMSVFVAALGLVLDGRVTAQTFTTLHNFIGLGQDTLGLALTGLLPFRSSEFPTLDPGHLQQQLPKVKHANMRN